MNSTEALPLDPQKELFVWGPNKLRIFYCADWFEAIFARDFFRKSYPDPRGFWPTSLILYLDGQIVFLGDLNELEENGGWLFKNYVLPEKTRTEVKQRWLADLGDLHVLEKKLDQIDIHSLSEVEFKKWWHEFHQKTINFWTHGVIPELANYGSIPILKKALIQGGVEEKDMSAVLEVLTAPEEPSFYQKEEITLSKANDIQRHTQEYFWLRNNYGHVEILNEDFFTERKHALEPDVEKKMQDYQHAIRKRKQKYLDQYSLSPEIGKISEAIVECIEWQDNRKGEIWKYLHYKDLLLNEASRRLEIEKDDLLNFREVEIEKILNGKDIPLDINDRRRGTGLLCKVGRLVSLSSVMVKKYWNTYLERAGKIESTSQIAGTVVSKGKSRAVKGKVRIIRDPYGAGNFEEGNILVTTMTTPEFVFLMKKASAVITDTGGLTSHAAIVSRELGKPCIVGTKVATRVLKDDDEVEVDTEKGIVKIIK